MSKERLSKGEKKIISARCLDIKDAVNETGLSYGYCRKVLACDYIQNAIKEQIRLSEEEEKKVDKRIGNQFWKARSSHGRKPIFESPEQLWEAAVEYFEWVENNPLNEEKLFCYQGRVTRGTVYKMRAMTIDGLSLFLDITDETWRQYRKKDGFSGVTARIDKIIKAQKFAGAAADLLNPNIIARDLGLKDKKELSGGLSVVSMDDKDKDA